MSKYVLKRLAMLIPVLIGVTFMVYFILSLSPGDTAAMIAGESADAETIEATRKDLGLDQPVIVQYGKYMLNLLHGDMGKSYKTKRDVFPDDHGCIPEYSKACVLVNPGSSSHRASDRYHQCDEAVQRDR